MKDNMDRLEQAVKDEFDRVVQKEEAAISKDESLIMPEGVKETMYEGILRKVNAMKQEELYANMSEEDRRALEIGRKIMEEEANAGIKVKIIRKKRRVRMYIGLAAALVLAMAVGVTSLGGPERIIQMVTQMVGDREVTKINSSDKNLIIIKEDEEEAYQKIYEEFGVDPVRIIVHPKEMRFTKLRLDENMQVAEMNFKYEEEQVVYLINASYSGSSWGIDIEDNEIKRYEKKINGCFFEIKEYETLEANVKRYLISFQYNNLEYFFLGTMTENEVESILNNLFFPK